MPRLFRSAGLAPVAGTIDWLTRARREKRFSAGLVPVESTTRLAYRDEQFNHALDRDKTGTGRGISPGPSFSLPITARRGQAPDVAEQNEHRRTITVKPDFAHARMGQASLSSRSPNRMRRRDRATLRKSKRLFGDLFSLSLRLSFCLFPVVRRSLSRSTAGLSLFLLFAAALSPVAFAAPPARGKGAKQQQSLDEALLEDLDAGTHRRATPREQAPKRSQLPEDDGGKSPGAKEPRKRSLDDELLDGLEGEDVSMGHNPANENPLKRLNERMKQVERRIADTHSDEKTQRLQQEISDDLSKLIAQLEQQCRQSKKSASSAGRQQTSHSKPETRPSQQPGEKPDRDSSQQTKERGAAKVDPARLQEMLKDVWGHLPLHLRQQMEQSANEEFLPKYETEISEYYRSLMAGRKERK